MVVSYDSYDYPHYWQKRRYEDQAEKLALKKLLKKIPFNNSLIDIGSGFGRLTPIYQNVFKRCLLVDPSAKLLSEAKKKLKGKKKLEFKQGKAQKLPVEDEQFEVALFIRVSHHLPRLQSAVREARRILQPNGYLILEFANKIHFKSLLKAFFKIQPDYLSSHIPKNISSRKTIRFVNYHPTHIRSLLFSQQFEVVKTLSVSNFRTAFFKKYLPLKLLLILENLSQSFLAFFYFGPSIFILAKKQA